MIKVAVDAMGGDYAPAEIVKGAVWAARENPNIQIILVGQQNKLKKIKLPAGISVVHAEEIIEMNESPAQAVRSKKDSSINIAVNLVKTKQADAVITAGNTGALMAASLFGLGRIPGIERPAIATIFPAESGPVLILDMGANVDNKPEHLKQFGEMGSIYAEHVMNKKNPRVGLLNIGEEPEKGNEVVRQAWPLLKKTKLNFVGMVESKEIMSGKVDVVVCDGFIGNLILKFAESMGKAVYDLLKKEFKKHPFAFLGMPFLLPIFNSLRKSIEYDEYGAAPLLGINGICFKAHGRSKARAIKNAIKVTAQAAKEDYVKYLSARESK